MDPKTGKWTFGTGLRSLGSDGGLLIRGDRESDYDGPRTLDELALMQDNARLWWENSGKHSCRKQARKGGIGDFGCPSGILTGKDWGDLTANERQQVMIVAAQQQHAGGKPLMADSGLSASTRKQIDLHREDAKNPLSPDGK